MRHLDEWLVRAFRELVRDGHATCPELAADSGIPVTTIQRAVYGLTWRHIPGALDSGQKPTRRLTEVEARQILRSRRSSPAEAARYGVADSTARHIRTGRTWQHL